MLQGVLDPTRKIARQVGWLNKNAQLKGKLSYTDVVEPLSRLDVGDAMKILKDLEESASKVDNPTGYVSAAAVRAGGIDGEEPQLAPPTILDPTGKIARQVGWLNRNLGLHEPISFSDVVEPLSWLDVTTAMSILKDVEEQCDGIRSPTEYVLHAAGLQGAPVGAEVEGAPANALFGGYHEGGGGGGEGVTLLSGSVSVDRTGKIARQVGWLNKNANLKEPLSFTEVVEPLSHLEIATAMQILKDLESQAEYVRNPTGYVAAAAARAGAGSTSGLTATVQAALDPTGKIGRQVGWLNKNADLVEPISFTDVVVPLSTLDVSMAMQILKDLEAQAPKVKNPTGYVTAAAARAGAVHPGDAAYPQLQGALDPTGKIGRQVGWLNKNAQLVEPISFTDVVEPLSMIDVTQAMKILKDVEEQAPTIKKPTGYVFAAAMRVSQQQGGALGDGLQSKASSPRGMPPLPSSRLMGASKRTWQEDASSPAADDEGSKQISRQVGRLNASAGLMEKISYSDVKQHLEAVGTDAALKILKDLESSAGTVKSPSSYIIAAAKRAATGESIPAKRTRVQ